MIGVVLAGGASSRFGGKPKGLALLAGKPLASHVADTLRVVCDSVAIEAQDASGYEAMGLPICSSAREHAGKGPIAGIIAGLKCAEKLGAGIVAFAPCDMPFVTPAHYSALSAGLDDAFVAYAISPGGAEPLVAIVRTSALPNLERALNGDAIARAHVILDRAGAIGVRFSDPAPFRNINTPADLELAARGSFGA